MTTLEAEIIDSTQFYKHLYKRGKHPKSKVSVGNCFLWQLTLKSQESTSRTFVTLGRYICSHVLARFFEVIKNNCQLGPIEPRATRLVLTSNYF